MTFCEIEKLLDSIDLTVVSKSEKDGVFVVSNEEDGIHKLIIGVASPVIIFEQYLFTLRGDNLDTFKALLMKNRDIVHGAFALTEDGKKVIFRYTLQLHNLDRSEFEAAINSLSLLLSEYYEQLIKFSKG